MKERAEAPKAAAPSIPPLPPLLFSLVLGPIPFSSFLFKGWLVSGRVYWQTPTFRIFTMDWVWLCRVQITTISMFSVQFWCLRLEINPFVNKCVSQFVVFAVCVCLLRCVFFCVFSCWPFCEGVYFASLILSPCVQCSQGDKIKLAK